MVAAGPDTLGMILAASMKRAGDGVAIRARGDIRTHRELLTNGARFANALAGLGVEPGQRVALMTEDRVETLEAYLGCFFGGFVPVHINDRLAAPEVAAILVDAQPSAFVHTDGRAEVSERGTELAAAKLNRQPLLVTIGTGQRAASAIGFADVLTAGSSVLPMVERAPDDAAIIGYTSGTTGTPKGVVHTQRVQTKIIRHQVFINGLLPGSRCAFTGTFSFVSGIWGVMLPHLYLGGELTFMAGLPADEWVARMIAERSNFTYVPSPLAPAFTEQVRAHPEVLESLSGVLHSGSVMPRAIAQDLVEVIGGRYFESYGLTETGSPVTRTVPHDWTTACEAQDVFASAGRVTHLASLAIMGPDGSRLAPGESGEIMVSAETMFAEYFNKPDLTAEVLSADGWLRTGDIGRLDDAGYLYVTDRAKDMIVSGGMNVFPAEVEAALIGLPGLAEVAVFGAPHERWGETVVAAVVVAPGSGLTEQEVIDWTRDRLAGYKKPTRVHLIAELPRNASLKVQKHVLKDRLYPS